MDDYDKLENDEKNEKFHNEFVEELIEEFQSGNIEEDVSRAEELRIGIEEIIS